MVVKRQECLEQLCSKQFKSFLAVWSKEQLTVGAEKSSNDNYEPEDSWKTSHKVDIDNIVMTS